MDAKKILLAEHDAFLINVYANQLRKSNYSISIAKDGDVVLSRIKSINPDLLVLDASLPGTEAYSNGFSVLKKIREELGLANLRVVMLSDFKENNYSQAGVPKKIFNFGIEKYFTKSENTAEEIADEIGRILS